MKSLEELEVNYYVTIDHQLLPKSSVLCQGRRFPSKTVLDYVATMGWGFENAVRELNKLPVTGKVKYLY